MVLTANNTYTGQTMVLGGTLDVQGSLANNGSNKVVLGVAYDGGPGGIIQRSVPLGGSYAGLGSSVYADPLGGSCADIREGVNATGVSKSVGMQRRNRTDDEAAGPTLISEVFSLSGMAYSGSQTDPFVLEMQYDPSQLPGYVGSETEEAYRAAGMIALGWLDNGAWKNAVLGDSVVGQLVDTTDLNYNGSWMRSSSRTAAWSSIWGDYLGSWGVDSTQDRVWAVLDHNSEFAATVPEPGTMMLLGAAALLLLAYRSRRSRTKGG